MVHSPPLNYTSIDEDFILFNRPFLNVSEYPLHERDYVRTSMRDKEWQRSFNLREDETAIWRNCTIYTQYSRELARFNYTLKEVEVREDWHLTNAALEIARAIVLRETANLTLINVLISPNVEIQLYDTASLTLVNVTNYSYGWTDAQQGMYWGYVMGSIRLRDNATAWIENSRIGHVDVFSPTAAVTVVNTELVGQTPYISLRVNATIPKTTYLWSEPISMTFQLENVGNETLPFLSDGTDRFTITAHEYETVEENEYVFYNNWDDLHYETLIPVAYRFPPTLDPGQVLVQTINWENPPLQPGTYCIEGSVYSKPLDLWVGCGAYEITISEENWQG